MQTLDIHRPEMPDLQFVLLVTALCTSRLTVLNIPETLRATIFNRCWALIHENPPPRRLEDRVLDLRPWTELTVEAMIETINQSRADFVLVALGAAKGQKWIERNRQRLAAPVIAHLGAVVDFAAGGIRRAPKAVRRLGLEWLWRIKEEPALWRRYFSDGAALAGLVWRDWPCLLATRSAGQIAGACEIRRSGAAATLKFSGDLTAGFRDFLRPALREAAESDGDIVIDLTAARRIDASFLGLLLMLEKAARKNGARILIADPGKRRRRLLEAHGMEYPVAESAEKGGHEEDNAIAAAS